MTEITQPIPARLRNVAVNGHVAGAADIIDDSLNKTQDEINQQIAEMKDKPYDPTEFSGMGRKVLPKNIQTVGGVEKNVLMQEMMPLATGQNTIYVIQYDYTLGENITVPANCILEFDGGSISGAYTLTGANSAIIYKEPFLNNVTLQGTFNTLVDTISDKEVFIDNNHNFNRIASLFRIQSSTNKYLFEKATYNNVEQIDITHNFDVDFSGSTLNLKINAAGEPSQFLIMPKESRGQGLQLDFVTIRNCAIYGNPDFDEYDDSTSVGLYKRTIQLFNVKHIELINISFTNIDRGRGGDYSQNIYERNELSMTALFYYDTVLVKGVIVRNTISDNLIMCVPNIADTFTECCYCENYTQTGLIMVMGGKVDIHHNYAKGFDSSQFNLPGIYHSKIHDNVFEDAPKTSGDGECIDFGYNDFHPCDVEVYNNYARNVKTFLFMCGCDIHVHDNIVRNALVGIFASLNINSDARVVIPKGTYMENLVIENNDVEAEKPAISSTYGHFYNRITLRNNRLKVVAESTPTGLVYLACAENVVIEDNTIDGEGILNGGSAAVVLPLFFSGNFPKKMVIKGNKFIRYTSGAENCPVFIYRLSYTTETPLDLEFYDNYCNELTGQSYGIAGNFSPNANITCFGNKNIKDYSVDLNSAIANVNKIFPKGTHTIVSATGKSIWWNGTAWVDATGATV